MTRGLRLMGGSASRWLAALCGASVLSAASCDSTQAYRIGIVASTDGLQGARMAVDDLNAAGGVNGHRLELRNVGGSSNSSAAIALQVAETLAADPRVLAVIGHPNSSASLAASQVYNSRHVVQLAPTSTTPLYSQAGPYSFRLVGSDVYQARFLANAIVASAPRSVAIVYVNDDYGRALHGSLEEALAVHDVKDIRPYPYAEEDSAGKPELLASLVHQRPDAIAWLGRVSYFTDIAVPLRQALPGLSIFASDGFGSAFVDDDTTGRFAGIRHTRLIDVTRPDTMLQRVRARYRSIASTDMSDEAALTYDAVLVLAVAVREAGPDRGAIQQWLAKVGREQPPVRGVTGPIAFDAAGDRVPQYTMVTAGRRPSTPPTR